MGGTPVNLALAATFRDPAGGARSKRIDGQIKELRQLARNCRGAMAGWAEPSGQGKGADLPKPFRC